MKVFRCSIYLIICFVFVSCSARIEQVVADDRSTTGTVNINVASVDELEKLPHIGKKTAESIVEFRQLNGPFRRVEHLMQIRGISEERFAELRPFIKTE